MNIINSKNKDNSLNYREEENIILTIRMILLLIGFSLVFSIIDIGFMLFGIADDYSGLFIDGSFLIFYLISYFLCKKGKNRYGRVLFVIVGNFHAGLTALYFGKGSGAEWHILEFFLIPMLLFSRKDKWFIFSSMILSFSIWMVVQYYNKYLPSIHKWSPEKLGILYTMNTIFVYIIVAACMFYFFKAIHNAENNLYKEKLVSESLLLNILPKRISDR
ncbi:MAG: hypothetical protein KDK36_20345, partial [Leptospiraceae bacterium]|nr:hypothetical protein [Leptospiraceae bacterium]